MARDILDRKLRHLFDEILILDSMVEQATAEAVAALQTRDLKRARRVYDNDNAINARRYALENDLMITIATQQPIMATDLRTLASMLEVVGELERIGDYAKGIAKVCLLIGDQPHLKLPPEVVVMGELVGRMLHRAAGAFVSHDVQEAQIIPAEDDRVDALYNQVYRKLVDMMVHDPTSIDHANYLMWAAHNLERMADRVTNICERTLYVATGTLREVDVNNDNLLRDQEQ
jgi:phosphate transport system protein